MKRHTHDSRFLLLAMLSFSISSASSQTSVDCDLLAEIQKIKAIDNHSHALPFRNPDPAEGDRPDPLGKTPELKDFRTLASV